MLAKAPRKVFVHLKGVEQEGPAPPTNNERALQARLTKRRDAKEGKYEDQ